MKRYSILFIAILTIMHTPWCIARVVSPGERLWNMQRLVTESSSDETIHQSDVVGSALTISSEGVYCLAEDIVGRITIATDHVVLNLNGKQLSNPSDDAVVVNGVADVGITNGFIGPSSGYGVYIAPGSSEVVVSKVEIKECTEAIRCDSSSRVTIDQCDLMLSTTGVTLYDSSDVKVQETKAVRNAYAGFSLLGCNGNQFSECSALYTGYNSTAPLLDVYGFISDGGTANVFESCIAQRTLALTVTGGYNVAAGFAFTGTENSSKIIDCESDVVQTYEDGYAMPYGILLQAQFDELVTVTGWSQGDDSWAVSWSPDGAYLATAGKKESGSDGIQLFLFDRSTGVLTKIDGISIGGISPEIAGQAVAWSPDGSYLAAGVYSGGTTDLAIQLFLFDRSTGILTRTDGKLQGSGCRAISWLPDSSYLATAGSTQDGDEIQIFACDRATGVLTKTDGAEQGSNGRAVSWSPDGTYIATGGSDQAGYEIQIFPFNKETGTLSSRTGIAAQGVTCYGVAWSPDGSYLATIGDGQDPGDYEIQVFPFNKETGTLSSRTGVAAQGVTCYGVAWSPDGSYLATIGDGQDPGDYEIQVFLFNKTTGALSARTGVASQGSQGRGIAWSPDGAYLATAGETEGSYDEIQIFQALTFPSNNVIKNNIVHGASGNSSMALGVGISGSSIENCIVGNTAYDNALSNYYFVQNIFNPLFFETPTLLQNMSIIAQVPLYTIHPTIPAIAPDGIRYLRQKNVYNNGITFLLPGSYAFAEDITAGITIASDDVVLDLAGHTLTNTAGDAITISGRTNVTVKNGTVSTSGSTGIAISSSSSQISIEGVTVESCMEGIRCDTSSQITIDHCDLMLSTTGMTLYSSSDIEVKHTKAVRNAYAGFSLLGCNGTQFSECSSLYTGFTSSDPLTNVYGFVSDSGSANVFASCIAQRTLALTVTGVNNVAAGFAFTGTENHSKIIDCESDVVQTNENGYAMPYGILLKSQFDELVTVTWTSQGYYGYGVAWSPDGSYLATAGQPEGGTNGDIQLFYFDRAAGTLTKLDSQSQGTTGWTVSWSPDGTYLATGGDGEGATDLEIQIFLFDRVAGKLTKTDSKSQGSYCRGVVWSPDGTYLATVGKTEGLNDEIQLFSFDRATGVLTKMDGASQGGEGWAVSWSPDGSYLATAGADNGSNDEIQIFSFDRATGFLNRVTGIAQAHEGYAVAWSPDGFYLATGGDNVGDALQIFSFDRATGTMSKTDGTLSIICYSVSWSPDGTCLAIGGSDIGGNTDVQVFVFDKETGRLTRTDYASKGESARHVLWSPDGAYFAVAGDNDSPYDNEIQIFQALTFPSNNVIKNNIVHGASGNSSRGSGVGISGSSIENLIVGNMAYDNALSNYYFVQNVFNSLFFEAPSLLQNMSMVANVPLYTIHPTIPAISLDGIRYLRQKNVYNNGIALMLPGSYALAEDITAEITIVSDDVMLDLGGHTLTNTAGDAITISGRTNVAIKNGMVSASGNIGISISSSSSQISIEGVTVESCMEGIRCDNSSQIKIKDCDLMLSTTGMTLYDSFEVKVRHTKAVRNAYAGFSLLMSNGNQFSECSALYTGYGLTDPLMSVYGFISDSGTANIFESCIAQRTLALTVTGGYSVAAGFAFTGTENSSKIIDCESDVAQTSEDGYAMSYGILLTAQADELITIAGASQGTKGYTVAWSPDGVYLVTGGTSEGGDYIQLFSFDRVTGTLTKIRGVQPAAFTTCYSVAWSPDGSYLAVGGATPAGNEIQIFSFDRNSGALTQTDAESQGNECDGVSWSPDGAYLATAGLPEGGNDIQVFSFNRATGQLSYVAGATHDNWGWSVAWSPDGRYLATVGDNVGDALQIFSFDRVTGTLNKTDGAIIIDCYFASWSYDGHYLAVAVNGGTAMQIFSFDGQSGTLSYVTGSTYFLGCYGIAWSPDGRYLAAIGNDVSNVYEISLFSFDRSTGQLCFIDDASQGDDGWYVAWSLDGVYLATAGGPEPTNANNEIQVFRALIFPSNNIVKHNIVHGASGGGSVASGIGISGSDIENFILGNNAYNNQSVNYAFVTDIYDQRFDAAPNLLQNISRREDDPRYRP